VGRLRVIVIAMEGVSMAVKALTGVPGVNPFGRYFFWGRGPSNSRARQQIIEEETRNFALVRSEESIGPGKIERGGLGGQGLETTRREKEM